MHSSPGATQRAHPAHEIHQTYASGHMHVEEPTDPVKSLVGRSNLFCLTWKACRHKARLSNYSATID